MSLPPPKLELSGIAKTFRQANSPPVTVFENLSFAVAPLEFVAILGPSGCGKSTLLRLILGLIECDNGRIVLDGEDVSGKGYLHRMGMVFQQADLFPWRTVRQNVEFGLEAAGVPLKERHAISTRYIDLVGLSGFENAYPRQLSGGMQQRVGTARALAISPNLLLMDEPFGALDIQTRELMQTELLRVWDEEKNTVLFVTHSIEEAVYLADRVIVLSPRPTRVDRIVEVPFERPRSEDIKTSLPFVQLRQEIWEVLKANVHI